MKQLRSKQVFWTTVTVLIPVWLSYFLANVLTSSCADFLSQVFFSCLPLKQTVMVTTRSLGDFVGDEQQLG